VNHIMMSHCCKVKDILIVLKLLLCTASTLFLCTITTTTTANATPTYVFDDSTATTAVKTLFAGDSDIDYWSTSTKFPDSINVGVAGFTCKQVSKKIGKHLKRYNPEWVVLVCGENDLDGKSVAKTFKDFMNVVTKIVRTGSRVIYMGTKPEPRTKGIHSKYREYDAKIRAKAKEMATSTISNQPPPLVMVDVHPVFKDIEMETPGVLYKKDRLHMSKKGYSYWNTWATTALADDIGLCIRWKDNVCDEKLNDGLTAAPSKAPSLLPGFTPAPMPTPGSPSIVVGEASVNVCPLGYQKIQSKQGCQAAVTFVGLSDWDWEGDEDEKNWPSKCYFCDNVNDCTDGVWFNEHRTGKAKTGVRPICALPGWEEDNVCGDDSDWIFTVKKKVRDCDWVGKRKAKRCSKKGDDGKDASAACRYSCIEHGSTCGVYV